MNKEMTKNQDSIKQNDFVADAVTQFNEWQDELIRLEEKIMDTGGNIEQAYRDQIADLKNLLHEASENLSRLKSTEMNSDQWAEQRARYQQAMQRYDIAYDETMTRLRKDENTSLGWLEGFTDHPPAGSAGWLEGTGAQAEGSEGWVEGMAERTPDSEGWVEGYGSDK